MTKEELAGKLAEIIKKAESRKLHIRREEIGEVFAGEALSEEQLKLVYDYLLSRKIVVEGYLKEPESGGSSGGGRRELSPEDRKYREEYQELLQALRPEEPGERRRLFSRLAEGDRQARDRLSEILLPEVARLAEAYQTEDVLLSDLVQEGSLCLLQALDAQAEETCAGPDAAEDRIMQEIRQGLQALTEQQKEVKSRDRRMVSRVQDLKDSVAILKEEMGRKVYLDEVADFMSISEEEAEAILKLAGEEVPKEE
jgi:hypothetical protein